ncbi:Hypothetical predicted protein [Paramuricea clavata]|uniref:Uncharacterized protein n=1 Tax=Paramuricea clavata TaxID=317549 RepID=A0A7D9DQ85_PARCT|nr:Hypothetical predicted protein [Paramuricea clavata]
MKDQTEKVLEEIEKSGSNNLPVNFLKLSVTQKLWDIVFAMDSRKKTATRQKYITQHLTVINEYRSLDELLSGWKAVLASYSFHTEGRLLSQKIISAVYEKICEFRSISALP